MHKGERSKSTCMQTVRVTRASNTKHGLLSKTRNPKPASICDTSPSNTHPVCKRHFPQTKPKETTGVKQGSWRGGVDGIGQRRSESLPLTLSDLLASTRSASSVTAPHRRDGAAPSSPRLRAPSESESDPLASSWSPPPWSPWSRASAPCSVRGWGGVGGVSASPSLQGACGPASSLSVSCTLVLLSPSDRAPCLVDLEGAATSATHTTEPVHWRTTTSADSILHHQHFNAERRGEPPVADAILIEKQDPFSRYDVVCLGGG